MKRSTPINREQASNAQCIGRQELRAVPRWIATIVECLCQTPAFLRIVKPETQEESLLKNLVNWQVHRHTRQVSAGRTTEGKL
jgi:hypothetical protein